MLEIALCFMILASITTLIYSEGFKKLSPSLLFGVFLGSGLLTKQFYIIFIVGPLIFLLYDSFFSGDFTIRRKIIKNLLLSLLIGIGIASWWYIPNFKEMAFSALNSILNSVKVPHDIPVFSLRSIFFYLEVLINDQIMVVFFLVFVFSVFIFFKRKKDKFFFLFLVWIILPYFVFILIKNKFWYYTIPYLPAVSLISAYGMLNIKRNLLRKTVILLILTIGFFRFFITSYIEYRHISLHIAIHTGTKKDEDRTMDIFLLPMKDILTVKHFPQKGDWKRDAIAMRILRESNGFIPVIGVYNLDPNVEARKKSQTSINMSEVDNYVGSDFDGLRYYLALKHIPHRIFLLDVFLEDKIKNKINFIISPIKFENIDTIYGLKSEDYILIEEFIMPDKSKVYLYKLNKIIPFKLNYTPCVNPSYKKSSARIDIHSEDMKFTLEEVKSNGVAQIANWLPKEQDWAKNWITQMELITNSWQRVWIEFVPSESGSVFVVIRGSLYLDNKTNHHEVYVDDVVIKENGITVENDSFEEQNSLDNPIGWDLPFASVSQVANLPHSGNYSMITWHDSPIVRKIPVKAGVKYRIEAWFKPY